MARSTLLAVPLVAGLVLLSSCGDDSDDSASPPSPAPAATSPAAPGPTTGSTSPASSAPETTGAPATTAPTSTGASEAGTVTIDHYSGTDTVPVDPETVVVLDTGVLLTLDAIGFYSIRRLIDLKV